MRDEKKYEILPGVEIPDIKKIQEAASDFSISEVPFLLYFQGFQAFRPFRLHKNSEIMTFLYRKNTEQMTFLIRNNVEQMSFYNRIMVNR